MAQTLLLYGATGFSGRLIAAAAQSQGLSRSGSSALRMIVAGRNAAALQQLGAEYDMEWRAFPLSDPSAIGAGLAGVDVVINAAGPFAATAGLLLEAAIVARCGYVDITGEVEVYMSLRERAASDDAKAIAIVSGVGASGGLASVLADLALGALPASSGFGAVRIAHSQEFFVSRGSVATALGALTHQVMVVRQPAPDDGCSCCPSDPVSTAMQPARVPVGALERAFDFGVLPLDEGGRRIGSGFSAVDTLAVWDAMLACGAAAKTIESYEAIGALGRLSYLVVANVPLVFGLPLLRNVVDLGVSLLPEGPTPAEMDKEKHAVVLQIDDAFGAHLIDWRLTTPNVYLLTARLALGAAIGVSGLTGPLGWTSCARALGATLASFGAGPFADCALDRRLG